MTDKEFHHRLDAMAAIARDENMGLTFDNENCLGRGGVSSDLCCPSACRTCGFERREAERRKKLPLYKREDGLCGKITPR